MVASYESDTIASCFRLFFAVISLHQTSSLHRLKNNLKRAPKFCGGASPLRPIHAGSQRLPRATPFAFPFHRNPCYSFRVPTFRFQGATHGMDHTATRRNRPELRNQLVRQRGTVVFEFQISRLPLSASQAV
jgi:hypothetical protein